MNKDKDKDPLDVWCPSCFANRGQPCERMRDNFYHIDRFTLVRYGKKDKRLEEIAKLIGE